MTSGLRRLIWSLRGRRKEDELRAELEFHLEEEAEARQAEGLPTDQAQWAARRDLGNMTALREETRIDVPNASRLVAVQRTTSPVSVQGTVSRLNRLSMSPDAARRVRDMSSFESAALSTLSRDLATQRLAVSLGGAIDRVEGRFVSASYFHVLGVAPAARTRLHRRRR